jgi:Phage baseplate assembly protein W
MAQNNNDLIQTDARRPRFLDYPYRVSGNGTPNTITPYAHLQGAPLMYTADDHLRDLIVQVLLTNPGERVNLPEFGVGVQRLVFEPSSEAMRATTQFLISNNLQRWLGDRITVEGVTVSSEVGYEETVTIEILYIVKVTQERQRVQVQV